MQDDTANETFDILQRQRAKYVYGCGVEFESQGIKLVKWLGRVRERMIELGFIVNQNKARPSAARSGGVRRGIVWQCTARQGMVRHG